MDTLDKPTNAETWHAIRLSDNVQYRYLEGARGRTDEQLVASGRSYPGVRLEKRFYAGLHHEDRFLPGIVWNGRFVPGLLTPRGLIPGLAVNKGFTPGILAAGIFLPGVIHGTNFVPGALRDGRFSPGCFTFDQQFLPGRFVRGRFESGVVQGHNFVSCSFQTMTVDETRSLQREDYGLATVDRFAPLGGIPIGGLVIGKFPDGLGYLPCGIATNKVLIPGGIGPGENLRVIDPIAKLEDLLGKLGFEIDEDDIASVLGEKGDALFKRAEDSLSKLRAGSLGIESGFDLWAAVDGLSSGVNALIDGLNQGWSDYWSEIFSSNSGGIVAGSDGHGRATAQYVGGVVGWMLGAAVGGTAGAISGTATVGPGGGVIGMGLGTATGMETGVEVGAWIGGAVYDVGEFFVNVIHSIFGGGTSASEDGEGDDGTSIITDRPVKPLMPYFSTRKTLIEFDRGDTDVFNIYATPIKLTWSDTGAMVIVNYQALKQRMRGTGRRGHAVLNPITGEVSFYLPSIASWDEVYDESRVPWQIETVARPLR